MVSPSPSRSKGPWTSNTLNTPGEIFFQVKVIVNKYFYFSFPLVLFDMLKCFVSTYSVLGLFIFIKNLTISRNL